MTVTERFLTYVSYDTQSSETSDTQPSTLKQRALGELLARHLEEMGLEQAHLDEFGYVYGWLPATPGMEQVPTLGLISHMDTSPSAPGANVKPRLVPWNGGPVQLNEKVVLEPHPRYLGQTLIVTDGTTLLGADDKAGVSEIFAAVDYLTQHPELPHCRIAVCITPDEEIGAGADHFDVEKFGAVTAYTVDGGPVGEIEYENFNAANVTAEINGLNIHPGDAKNVMRNAVLIASEFISLLPPAETPAHTEGYEGFFHVCDIAGDETQVNLHMLVRDHDRAKFEDRKNTLGKIAAFLNDRYGAETVKLYIRDMYYNMKAQIEPHMELIENAKTAMSDCGVVPQVVAIRGGTDGARLSYMGLPCPNLSTGGMNYHSIKEYCSVEALEKMTEVLVRLISLQK